MDDNGRRQLVDKLLAHLEKNGDDGRIRELAAGIRQGNAGWAESLAASSYAQALQPKLDGFIGWYQHLGESDRATEAERCQSELDHMNRTQSKVRNPGE
jgi:hypothetical protein